MIRCSLSVLFPLVVFILLVAELPYRCSCLSTSDHVPNVTNMVVVTPVVTNRHTDHLDASSRQQYAFWNDNDDDDDGDDEYQPLVHWLDHLQITIPDLQYTVDFFTIHIQDMTCTHFSVSTLQSTYQPSHPSSSSPPQLQFVVQNISASCSGVYSVTPGTIRGMVLVALGTTTTTSDANPNALEWTMIIRDNPNDHDDDNSTPWTSIRQPSNIQTVGVATQLQVTTLQLTGSISAQIIALFQNLIVSHVNHAIQDQLGNPTLFQTKCDPLISHQLQSMMRTLRPYLTPQYHSNVTMTPTGAAQGTTRWNPYDSYHHRRASTTTTGLPDVRFDRYPHPSTTTNDDNDTTTTLIQYDTDLPLLYQALTTINTFLVRHLSTGLLPRVNHSSSSSSSSSTPSSCGGLANGINGLMEALFGGTLSTSLTMPLPVHWTYLVPQYHKNLTIYVHTISISGPGWSHLRRLLLLRPTTTTATNTTTARHSHPNETSFQNELELSSNVSLSINVTIYISDLMVDESRRSSSSSSDRGSNNTLEESFVVQVDLNQLHAAFDVVFDTKRYYLRNVITIDMIRTVLDEIFLLEPMSEAISVSTSNISVAIPSPTMYCLLQGIDQIVVHGLSGMVNVSRIAIRPIIPSQVSMLEERDDHSTSYHQPLEEDIDHLINTVLDLVTSEYPVLVTTAISGYLQTNDTVQKYINDYLARHIAVPSNATTHCVPPSRSRSDALDDTSSQTEDSEWFNFSHVGFLRQLNSYLNQSTTISRINVYVDCSINTIKEMVRDTFIPSRENTTKASNHDNTALTRSTLQIVDLDIKNFGQFQEIQFVSPIIDGFHLRNSFVWNVSRQSPLEDIPTLFSLWKVEYVPLNVTAMVNATMLMNDVQWGVDTIIHLDRKKFLRMTLVELFSFCQCFLAPINSTDFAILGQDQHLHYLQLIVNATILMHSTNETLDVFIDTNDFSDAQAYISSIFEWSVDMMRDTLEAVLRSLLLNSGKVCYGDRSSTNDHSTMYEAYYMKPMFLILLAVFMLLQPAVLLMKRSSESVGANRQQQELIEPLLHHGARTSEPDDDHDDASSCEAEPKSFMMDENIPFFIQIAIPIAIISTIALLLTSNLSVGATVEVLTTNIYRDGQNLQIPSLFEFSLYNTARDMWNAQIYPLFFLVLMFSGIWPYMKLILMLFAWMGPTSMINPESRGRLLLTLDALSKFSLVDTYVLIVMMVAFRYQLPLFEESLLHVYVVPQFGFFGFLLATSVSLLLGHVLVYYHRHLEMLSKQLPVVRDGSEFTSISQLNNASSTPTASLCYHDYHFDDGSKRRLTPLAQYVLLCWFVLVLITFSIGIMQKCFVFEFGGLAGVLLSEGKNREAYSLLSFAAAIPSNTEHDNRMSTFLLQFVFIFYTIIMPLATTAFLTILWTVPMSWSSQYCLLSMAEIANAWSAVEVFCLSIVVALLEIETFANFMVGHKCDWIDQVLAAYHTTIGVDTCYSVTSSVTWNAVFLVASAILHSLLVSLILRFAQLSLHEKLLECNGEFLESMPHRRRSFLHRLALSKWGEMLLAYSVGGPASDSNSSIAAPWPHDNRPPGDDAVLSIFSEEVLTTPWEGMNDSEWKESVEHDATWKEWNEATNVT